MAYSYGSQDPAQSPAAAAAQQSEPEANASDKSRSIFRAIYQKASYGCGMVGFRSGLASYMESFSLPDVDIGRYPGADLSHQPVDVERYRLELVDVQFHFRPQDALHSGCRGVVQQGINGSVLLQQHSQIDWRAGVAHHLTHNIL
jgi:hypothetical protein